jgi:hypothetical protein
VHVALLFDSCNFYAGHQREAERIGGAARVWQTCHGIVIGHADCGEPGGRRASYEGPRCERSVGCCRV